MEPRDELRTMLAKYANVEGEEGTLDDMAFFFSLKQNWFTMAASKTLLAKALEMGFLEENGDKLRLTFDGSSETLPAVFAPSNNLPALMERMSSEPQSAREDPLMNVISRIRDKTGGDVKSVMKEINKKQRDTGFTIEVAALLVAKYHNADVDDLFGEVKELLSNPE